MVVKSSRVRQVIKLKFIAAKIRTIISIPLKVNNRKLLWRVKLTVDPASLRRPLFIYNIVTIIVYLGRRLMAETLLLLFGVEKLWDLIVRESERFKGVDEQFSELKSDLNMLRCFLKDADAKKHTNAMVRNCVEEIKEIVCDAEDIIETFVIKQELGTAGGIRKRVRRLAFHIVDRMELATEIGGMSKKISKVILNMQSFGVQQSISDDVYSHPRQERQREMRKTFPSNYENDLVVLEENVKKLVGYLVEEDSIQVVSITGMGGIGKTTLARQVFNDEIVKNHFDGVAWVCISQHFTRKYVWQTILHNLQPNHGEITEDELQNKLFGLLGTQKSLIVLDDIWKEEDWDRIKPIFPQRKGWKVLLTSRNEGVALRADPTCVTFKPKCFTHQESWTLFQKIAFPKKDTNESMVDEEMEEMGKEMVKHCAGLPLAVKVLGGLLAAQYTLRQWKRVYENIGSDFLGRTDFSDDNNSLVYHVLSLSFEELPVYLKHCFLYLAHFPEDCAIDVEKLSYYWAAEGIPKPRYHDGASILDVADDYIEELVKRNMVIAERDVMSSRFETCHLHDMMREVCLLKAKEENFLQMIDARASTSTSPSQSICKSRRLVVQWPNDSFHEDGEIKNTNLRSLKFPLEYFNGNWMASYLSFTKLRSLRVLNLSGAQFKGGKLPSNIGELIHLRYLNLHKAGVDHLPNSLQNLKFLLYLNLHVLGKSAVYVPNVLKEMRELRFLALPRNMHDKTKLELSNLANLETLQQFHTKYITVRDLRSITRLRTLSITLNGGCSMETLSSSLSALRHLESLTIHDFSDNGDAGDAEEFVLDCINITYLRLQMYMPRLPNEQQFPSQLISIALSHCCLEEDPLPVLEKLLYLNVLSIGSEAFSGKKMVCSGGGFPQLQKLYLHGLCEWEEWIVEASSMPILRTLYVGCCENLKELPDGLRSLTSLEALRIGMMKREFKDKLEKDGEDYYKVQHVPCVVFM